MAVAHRGLGQGRGCVLKQSILGHIRANEGIYKSFGIQPPREHINSYQNRATLNSKENMANEEAKWTFIKAADFPVHGQGTLILTSTGYLSYRFVVTSDKVTQDGMEQAVLPATYIALDIQNKPQFSIKEEGIPVRVLDSKDDDKVKGQLDCKRDDQQDDNEKDYGAKHPECLVSYWFSYDRDTMTLKYGKGHRMEETTLLSYSFLADATSEEDRKRICERYHLFFTAEKKKRVIVYGQPSVTGGNLAGQMPLLQFRPNPFVNNCPPLVKDSSEVTLFDLDRGQYMFSSSLPSACQELYGNIKSLILDYPENPIMKLSDAIRYSIVTKGKTLYNKLQDKKKLIWPRCKGR